MKKHLADENLQFEIRHDPKNVIDLDAKTEESEPEKSQNSDGEKMIAALNEKQNATETAQNDYNDLELTKTKKMQVFVTNPLSKSQKPKEVKLIKEFNEEELNVYRCEDEDKLKQSAMRSKESSFDQFLTIKVPIDQIE